MLQIDNKQFFKLTYWFCIKLINSSLNLEVFILIDWLKLIPNLSFPSIKSYFEFNFSICFPINSSIKSRKNKLPDPTQIDVPQDK